MAIRLIAVDLDGTFLNSRREIPGENIAAVQAALAKGIIVTIATGRMAHSARYYAEQAGVSVPIITYNGALVLSTEGTVLSHAYLPSADVVDVIGYAEKQGWMMIAFEDDEIYAPSYDERVEGYEQSARKCAHVVGWDGLLQHTARVPKLLLITQDSAETDARVREVCAVFGGRISATRSIDRYAEIVSPRVSKGKALQELAARYGITMDEVMVCGDSENDRSMLEIAGVAVVMGNASPHIKALATHITATCDAAGVAQAIRKYVLQQISDGRTDIWR